MSHFAALVIGDDVDAQLVPYHEFECTGIDDEHVREVDLTAETRVTYDAADSATRGTFADFAVTYHSYDRCPAGQPCDLNHHKYGFVEVDAAGEVTRVVRRTNPTAKWDWYVIGGRWTGYFKLKPGATGTLGRPGVATAPPGPGRADRCRLGDVDLEAMRAEAGEDAARLWRKTRALAGEDALARFETWEQVRARFSTDVDAARTAYHHQLAQVRISAAIGADYAEHSDLLWADTDEALTTDLTAYVDRARAGALAPHAVVMKSEWYERGRMGWWGIVHDELSADAWNARVNELIDGLPPETLVTIVDCHI